MKVFSWKRFLFMTGKAFLIIVGMIAACVLVGWLFGNYLMYIRDTSLGLGARLAVGFLPLVVLMSCIVGYTYSKVDKSE